MGALTGRFDEKQLIELTLMIGQFAGVAYFQNALNDPGLRAG